MLVDILTVLGCKVPQILFRTLKLVPAAEITRLPGSPQKVLLILVGRGRSKQLTYHSQPELGWVWL